MPTFADFDMRDPNEIRRAIGLLQSLGAVGLPTILREGVLTGKCAFAGIARRDSAFPAAKLEEFTGPTILLIGDDDETPTGPLKWRSAKQAGRWADAVMVHGAGAEESHYRAAIVASQAVRRVLIVETSSQYALAWGKFLAHPRTLLVLTRDDAPHPVPRKAENVH